MKLFNKVRRAFYLGTFFGALALTVIGLFIPDLRTSMVVVIPSICYAAFFAWHNQSDKVFR